MLREKHQTLFFKIVRRTSKYSKYIKWYAETYSDIEAKQLVSLTGHRTQKEARQFCTAHSPVDIGNNLVFTHYQEIPK